MAGITATKRYLRNVEPLARVGMVYSQQTAHYYGGERASQKVEDHTLGYYQALIEARIPFEMVHDRLLDAAHLARSSKSSILPNIAALSDQQCRQIREYRGARRRRRGNIRNVALRRMGRAAAGFRPGSICSAPPSTAAMDARMQNSYLSTGERTRNRQTASDSGRPGRRRAHHQWRFARAHARPGGATATRR